MMQALKGSLVALVTPMEESGEVDYESLEKLIDWHINHGTNGIVSVGTTGESATLDVDEHLEVIKHTVEHVNSRVPVIAGTGANSTSEAIELTQESKQNGADFALIVTPYYNKPTQKGLISHYTKLANEVDIPQILYNVPSRTACDILPETVEILSTHNNIVGIKEAVDSKERIIVGVNDFIEQDEELDIEILKISRDAQDTQEHKIKTLRKNRDEKILQKKMKKLSDACKNDLNLVPFLIEVAEQGGTVGEIVEVMKKVYGEWEESFGI